MRNALRNPSHCLHGARRLRRVSTCDSTPRPTPPATISTLRVWRAHSAQAISRVRIAARNARKPRTVQTCCRGTKVRIRPVAAHGIDDVIGWSPRPSTPATGRGPPGPAGTRIIRGVGGDGRDPAPARRCNDCPGESWSSRHEASKLRWRWAHTQAASSVRRHYYSNDTRPGNHYGGTEGCP